MAKYYITPIGQVAKTVLPTQFSTKYTPRKFWYVKPSAKYDQSQVERLKARAPKQYKTLNLSKWISTNRNVVVLDGFMVWNKNKRDKFRCDGIKLECIGVGDGL